MVAAEGEHAVTDGTNLRLLTDHHVDWSIYFGFGLDALALFLAPLFDRVLAAGATDHEGQVRPPAPS